MTRRKPLSEEAGRSRRPLPPGELVDALQDRVHKDVGRGRAARTVRSRARRRCSSAPAWCWGVGAGLAVVGLLGTMAPRPMLRALATLGVLDTAALDGDDPGRKLWAIVDLWTLSASWPYVLGTGLVLCVLGAVLAGRGRAR